MSFTKAEVKMATVPETKIWSCVDCTFENLESDAFKCSLCGTANPAAKPQTGWGCRKCTFHNSAETKVCEMCHGSKGWQCPKCPLWNENNNAFKCEACGHSILTREELVTSAFMAAQQYEPTYPESEHDDGEVDIVGYEMPPAGDSKDGYSRLA